MHFFKACLRNNIMTPVLVCLVRCHAQLSEGLRTGLVEHWNVNTFKSQKMRFFLSGRVRPFPRETNTRSSLVWSLNGKKAAKYVHRARSGTWCGRNDLSATFSAISNGQFSNGPYSRLRWPSMEVYGFLGYESLAVLVHASRSVQHAYEPVALLRAAAGRVGHLRVRLHRTSLVHNLWKLWRRSIPAFSRSAWCPCPWRVLGRTSQSTGSGLRVATGSHRPDVLLASPMAPFMDLLLNLGPWHLDLAPPAPSSVRTGAGQHVGADRRSRRLASPRGGAPTRLRRIVPTYKPFNMPRFCPEKM